MIHKCFDAKSCGGGVNSEIISNWELGEQLHKPISRKFEKRKVHSFFIGNLWGTDLADKQLISNCNKGFCFLLCVLDI